MLTFNKYNLVASFLVPVINNLAQTAGLSLPTLAWALALGTDIGGNATPIGASANVVGTAIAERELSYWLGKILQIYVPVYDYSGCHMLAISSCKIYLNKGVSIYCVIPCYRL